MAANRFIGPRETDHLQNLGRIHGGYRAQRPWGPETESEGTIVSDTNIPPGRKNPCLERQPSSTQHSIYVPPSLGNQSEFLKEGLRSGKDLKHSSGQRDSENSLADEGVTKGSSHSDSLGDNEATQQRRPRPEAFENVVSEQKPALSPHPWPPPRVMCNKISPHVCKRYTVYDN